MSNELVQVQFHGDTLDAIQDGGKVWVSLRRCCENLGIAVENQLKKLKGKSWAVMMEKIMTGPDGKPYSMIAVELKTLPGWLFSIDARKVKEEVREKLALYQNEAAQVLADHFFKRTPAPVLDLLAIKAIVTEAVVQHMATILPAAVHIPTHATPRTTIQKRLKFKNWLNTTKKQRNQIRRLANTLLDLRHGETPDVSGGPGNGGPCLYYGHQIPCLDEAIDEVREEYQRRDAAKGPHLFTKAA